MLLSILVAVISWITLRHLHYTNVIQQCEKYISLIAPEHNIENIDKIPECISFLEKNWIKIRKKAFINKQYKDKIESFLSTMGIYTTQEIYKKRDLIYRKQLAIVLTHTIKDKNLKQLIITEIQDSKYIPKIENNEKEHFSYNLLNHLVDKGSPVDWEHIDIEYPDVFKNINSLCLQYLKNEAYSMSKLINKLQKIGQSFITDKDKNYPYNIIRCLGRYLYPKTDKEMLEYLIKKNLIDATTAKKYQSILDKDWRNDKILEEQVNVEDTIKYLYVKYIIEHGSIDDYLWLSDGLGWLLFRVDSPYRWDMPRFRKEWVETHKKMLDARVYGINPLLLFAPDDFKGKNNYFEDDNRTIYTDSVIRLKQDIDNTLSVYYPVPNFLNHAREILDAYITENMDKLSNTTWYNDNDRKLNEIHLQTLTPYDIFGYSVAYLTNYDTHRYSVKYLNIQDSAFIAYLNSLCDKTFDDICKLCDRINWLHNNIYHL